MPIDASVMPTWHAAMYSSIRSICRSASAAPFAPSFASDWTRSSRERTIEYSAATKNAFIRIRAGTPSRRTATTRGPPEASETSYFEEVLGRASASDARLPEAPGGTARVVEARRAISLVLPDDRRAPARARDPRPPRVAAARARVAHQAGCPASRGRAHPDRAHHAPPRARVLERHERVALADRAERRRERGDLACAVRVDLPVGRARRGDERVVLRVRARRRRVGLAPVGPRDQRLAGAAERRVRRVGQLLLVVGVVRHAHLLAEGRAAVAREPREH